MEQLPLLNENQRSIHDEIIGAIFNPEGRMERVFFIEGPGGTGKTFLYNLLLAKVRSEGEIALAVASSGIAALLLDGGRTAHSMFKIPINISERSTCAISVNSPLADIIRKSKVVI